MGRWIGREFPNRLMKSFFQNDNTEMYPTHNEGKSIFAERCIRTLKNYMTSISKIAYIDKLDGKVNKYSNTYHSTI